MLFDGVPEDIDLDRLEESLLEIPHILAVHDLHIWVMSTEDNALTAHWVHEGNETNQDVLLCQAIRLLEDRFGIRHSTLQCESWSFVTHYRLNANCGANTANKEIRKNKH